MITPPETHPSSVYLTRQAKLSHTLQAAKLDAIVLNPGPSLVYLTGLHFHLSERPVILLLLPGQTPLLVLPELELAKTQGLPFSLQPFAYQEDLESWLVAFRQAAIVANLDHLRVGFEPRRLRLLEYNLLLTAAPQTQYISAEDSLAVLRMYKDDNEIMAMRKAADIAQRALQATLPLVHLGITERQLASELTLQTLRLGSDPEIPFAPIVSGGPNSANPHATPADRPLQAGDLLVFDWGASYQGYFSDITRTFAIGEIEPEYARIGQVVLEANSSARLIAGPSATASQVDRAARSVIESAGYGPYFTHRTGHGLGMEGHEEPYIRSGSDLRLEPGMTFTIEPGIYLPARNGVRIEDDIVITPAGAESLTDLPREIIRLV
jgi:Xaa-Pro dipeptidase